MNAITAIRLPGDDLSQKDDVAIAFLDRHTIVPNPDTLRLQLSHLVIVCGKKCAGTQLGTVMDILRNGPRKAETIVGAGPATDFIQ